MGFTNAQGFLKVGDRPSVLLNGPGWCKLTSKSCWRAKTELHRGYTCLAGFANGLSEGHAASEEVFNAFRVCAGCMAGGRLAAEHQGSAE